MADNTPPELVDETVRAVQAINAALPRGLGSSGFNRHPARADGIDNPEGKILITFAPQVDWPRGLVPPTGKDVGFALPLPRVVPTGDPEAPYRIEIVAGRVWVDHTATEGLERLGVIAHELIHLLGRGHVDSNRFPSTIMVPGGSEELTEHILHPLDREALLAVYGGLEPGTTPSNLATELGAWSDTSLHVRGAIDIQDGENLLRCRAQETACCRPWGDRGHRPMPLLRTTPKLSGSVSWSGRLVGLTPDAETVAGAADLSVNLTTLTGDVEFTGLEQWAANAAPGALGTGDIWSGRRPELRYRSPAAIPSCRLEAIPAP